MNRRVEPKIEPRHTTSYYLKCFFAGLFPCGLTHTLLTPLDIVKCRRQVNPELYKSLTQGIKLAYHESGLRGLYLGWQPTILGYGIQGSTKYGFYEIFKDLYKKILGENANKYRTIGYMLSSACAEVIADVFLCPWESLKVRMQTSPGFPKSFFPAVAELQKEGRHGFYKGLVPLIFRQVPNTMVKFATYENTVKLLYTYVWTKPKSHYNKNSQLIVTFLAGYVSGAVCCLFSNPADTIVSKYNAKKTESSQPLLKSVGIIYKEIGFLGLWRGFSTRVIMVGTLSALEWLIYDSFKVMAGLPTTGEK
jgi:solute carrier family 25 (mitochondrial phosphate transporter), member 3